MTGPQDARTDSELVGAFLAGDGGALGAIYDRFAPGLYDTARAMLGNSDDAADVVQDVFCVAAAKLGQLRDRDRVKPWLYAVARHEVFRRTKHRRRETPVLDAGGPGGAWELPATADPRAEGASVESAELASVVRAAAGGLEVNDQLILELTVRQGLAGEDLAAALGVTLAQSHSLVFRMRERVERAIGAYVVTRGDRRDCPELATVLAGWDGTFDVLWRKRIARHIDGCDTCTERRRIAVGLASAAPAFAAPAWLRQRTLRAATRAVGSEPSGCRFDGEGFPTIGRRASHLGIRAAVAATVAAVLGLAVVLPLLANNDPDIVASIDSATISPAETLPSATTQSTTSTTSTTATTTTVPSVAPPQAPPTRPSTPTRPTLVLATTTTTSTLPATTTTTTTAPPPPPNQPPRVSRVAVSPSAWLACQPPRAVAVSAVASDDIAVQSVSASWSGPGGSGSASMSGSTTYSGSFTVTQHVPGTYSVVVTATDGAGATARGSTSFTITTC